VIDAFRAWLKREHEVNPRLAVSSSLAMMGITVNFFLITAVLGSLTQNKPVFVHDVVGIIGLVVLDLVFFAVSVSTGFLADSLDQPGDHAWRNRFEVAAFLSFLGGLLMFFFLAYYVLQIFTTLS
jgi:hypothetical protein